MTTLVERTQEKVRVMRCPYCGHETRSTGIGAIYCGPHCSTNDYYSPARQMHEVLESNSPEVQP